MTETKQRSERGRTEGTDSLGTSEGRKREGRRESERGARKAQKGRRETGMGRRERGAGGGGIVRAKRMTVIRPIIGWHQKCWVWLACQMGNSRANCRGEL